MTTNAAALARSSGAATSEERAMTDEFNDAERDYAALLRRAEEAEADRDRMATALRAIRLEASRHSSAYVRAIKGIAMRALEPSPPPRAEGSAG
jgi:hypothetical protein